MSLCSAQSELAEEYWYPYQHRAELEALDSRSCHIVLEAKCFACFYHAGGLGPFLFVQVPREESFRCMLKGPIFFPLVKPPKYTKTTNGNCNWKFLVPPGPPATFEITTQRLNNIYNCLADSSGLFLAGSYV